MKTFYALYDCNDNFISCGFTPKELGLTPLHLYILSTGRVKKYRVYKISTKPQDDIFNEEDKLFVKENMYQCFKKSELAKIFNVTERTIYRRRLRALKEQL